MVQKLMLTKINVKFENLHSFHKALISYNKVVQR